MLTLAAANRRGYDFSNISNNSPKPSSKFAREPLIFLPLATLTRPLLLGIFSSPSLFLISSSFLLSSSSFSRILSSSFFLIALSFFSFVLFLSSISLRSRVAIRCRARNSFHPRPSSRGEDTEITSCYRVSQKNLPNK